MTITYEQFAEFLLKHSVYYYASDESVHCYITENGSVRYFANWGDGETRDYASLKSLYEATTGRDLPDAEDLAEVIAEPLKFFRWAHTTEKPRHFTTLTGEEARAWLIENDREGAAFWSSPDLTPEDLIEAVGDNLRDFGDFEQLTAIETSVPAAAPEPREPEHHVITDTQFQERFEPVKNHLNPHAPLDGCMFETFGAELEFVREQDPALVWTIIDCDGTMSIESGCHFVNRLGYLVASHPRPDQSTYSVRDDDDETVTVDAAHLRIILDYLHDSEADHYDPETYPEEVNTHVYAHVLAIEAQMTDIGKGGAE